MSGPRRALVIGLGVTGTAVTRFLVGRGDLVTVVDDSPGADAAEVAAALGATLVASPSTGELARLVDASDLVVPNPGVRPSHPVFALARDAHVPVVGEVELGARQATVPLIAVTGTNGKTTVTSMIAAMLEQSGRRTLAAGNIGLPLVEAAQSDAEVIVVEVSSAQLVLTATFHPRVAVWLNFAEDHRDWHPTMEHYAESKARIFMNQTADDIAVVNIADDVVMAAASRASSRVVTFGPGAAWHVHDGALVGPPGVVVETSELRRALPHDVANALAAAAAAHAAGTDLGSCAQALREFEGLPHRITLVGEAGGVRWYDDSKATTPASVVPALQAFDSVVLIAGGRNKGLDLGVLAAEVDHVRAVIAIGEAAPDIQGAFEGLRPVQTAGSMDDAVRRARGLAQPGDAVLLSPGCASYDWYRSYGERGDDFARAVRALTTAEASAS